MSVKERIAMLEAKVEALYERILKLEHPKPVSLPKPNPFAMGPRGG